MNESTLEALVEGSNSDIRLILGQLQMVRLSSKALTYDEVKVHGTHSPLEMQTVSILQLWCAFNCA